MIRETLYLKLKRNIEIHDRKIRIGDLGDMICTDPGVEEKIKTLCMPDGEIKGTGRYVFSVLDVIQTIQGVFPNMDINNIGEYDFIVTVKKDKTSTIPEWVKTCFVCLISFFGAAFSIMAFNNDIGITELFSRLYFTFTGMESNGFTLLEISYSIGVGLGILIFYHSFPKKNRQSDPTPLEVEMRTYEHDIDNTIIENV